MKNRNKIFLVKIAVIVSLFFNSSFAQNYVESKCTLKSGKVIQGQLKNDFNDTDEFLYFKEDNQEVKVKAIDIDFLVINGLEKYLSSLIDFHPKALMSLVEVSATRNNNFDERTTKHVLLKVLVEGDVNLLQTQVNGTILYFIKTNEIEGLEYLQYYKYYSDENHTVKQNTLFRRQLYRNANCPGNPVNKFEFISYDERDLIKIINEHNICKGEGSAILKEEISFKESFRLSAFGGIKFHQGGFESVNFYNKGRFKDTHVSPNVGAELAFVVPNRKRNSELFSRLSYSNLNFESSKSSTVESGFTVIQERIKYEANLLEIGLGYRYFINSLKEKNNFGLDISYNLAYPINPIVEKGLSVTSTSQSIVDYSDDAKIATNISLGASYIYNSRFIFETRYTFPSDFLGKNVILASFSNINFNFRYLIF